MKLLNGEELAEYIQERQAQQVRSLRQANDVAPKLVVISKNTNNLLTDYASQIQVDVEYIDPTDSKKISNLNEVPTVHAITASDTEADIDIIASKDVDGRGSDADYDPARLVAINWLLAGYNVDLRGKSIVIIGNDSVAQKLAKIWNDSELEVTLTDTQDDDLIEQADVVVSMLGVSEKLLKPDAVVVDVTAETFAPLEVCALFDNVIRSARSSIKEQA